MVPRTPLMRHWLNMATGTILSCLAVSYVPFPSGPTISTTVGPCAGDLQRFCRDITPGKGNPGLCLKSYESQLTPGCQQEILSSESAWRKTVHNCGPEIHRFCQGVQHDADRMLSCLSLHENQLSSACRAEAIHYGGRRSSTG